ncbi:MAG: HAMP domain-containing sensor histidine kinase [Bdellovibrionota bacterium]|nr:HAMP domain-containing sensor histidine kinase [Bdellovibrionota bacterium]
MGALAFESEILEQFDHGVVILNSDRVVCYWNHKMNAFISTPAIEAVGQTFNQVIEFVNDSVLCEKISLCFSDGMSQILSSKLHPELVDIFPFYKCEKKFFAMKVIVSPITSEGDRFCMIQFVDQSPLLAHEDYVRIQAETITEQERKHEENLKLANIGQMAATVVHEINNPLSIITADAETLAIEKRANDLEFVLKKSERITRMVDRISQIVKGLKVIAHQGEWDISKSYSLVTTLRESFELSNEKLHNSNVLFMHNLNDLEDFEIVCNQVQVSQIVVNLISNACDAIVNHESKWVRVELSKTESQAEIRVIDCGAGLSQDVKDKIFDPFFTSKPVGKGTGLGLSVSLSIAEAHRGKLWVDDEYKNTCFCLSLPLVWEASEDQSEVEDSE